MIEKVAQYRTTDGSQFVDARLAASHELERFFTDNHATSVGDVAHAIATNAEFQNKLRDILEFLQAEG